MRFVDYLTEADVTTLEEALANAPIPKFRARSQCLLLSNKGFKIKELAHIFGVRTRTIYTWFNRYEEMGLVGLFFLSENKRQPILNTEKEEHIKVVVDIVKKNAINLKYAAVLIRQAVGVKYK